MSSAKTERLVNLTMALLGTKRYMSKSEIFRRVAGYSGSQETKERMFERDKDDLRNLGIEIDVASHDPLFEDEVGYRIKPESYQLPGNFSAEEMGIMSLALAMISEGNFASKSQELSRRLQSLTVSPALPEGIQISSKEISEEGLADILQALALRSQISFDYRKSNSKAVEHRRVNPMGISAWRGSWYLVGEDIDRDDIRVFKLSRIESRIELEKEQGSYLIPEDFRVQDYLIMHRENTYRVFLRIRKGVGLKIRAQATRLSPVDEEWDEIEVLFSELDEALREALWLGDDAVVLEPEDLRKKIREALTRLVATNG